MHAHFWCNIHVSPIKIPHGVTNRPTRRSEDITALTHSSKKRQLGLLLCPQQNLSIQSQYMPESMSEVHYLYFLWLLKTKE